jgi:hypothetical protein
MIEQVEGRVKRNPWEMKGGISLTQKGAKGENPPNAKAVWLKGC